jgi:hypothetical protein
MEPVKSDLRFSKMFAPIAWLRIPEEQARGKMREMMAQRNRVVAIAGDVVRADGLYVDVQAAPFHAVIVGRKEPKEHLLILLEGCAEVVTDKGLAAVGQAPCILRVEENERLVANVLTARLVFACVHPGEPRSLAGGEEPVVQ